MITDTPQTTAEATPEDEAALRRVLPYRWERADYYGINASSGRQPQWQVALRGPDEAAPLFKRAKADLSALSRLIDQDYTVKVESIQRRWSSGEMTPNQRAIEMAAAEQERATREAHVERAFAGLTEGETLQRAKDASQTAIDRTWAEAMAAHDTTGPNAA